jgi:hypothetical protein
MSDLDRLIRQVRRNCDISDARHAGMFFICGLTLRLRDLFKWEKGLSPWEEGDPALAFYVVFADSLSKALWPLLFESVDDFMRTGAWESVENAVAAAREAAGRLADRIMLLFRDGRDRNDLARTQVRIDQALNRHLDRTSAPV